MNISFCCHGFSRDNLNLMPWRYIHDLTDGLKRSGHHVSVLSINADSHNVEEMIEGIKVYHIKASDLFKNGIEKLMSADCIVWSSSPLTAFYNRKLRSIRKPFILLYTGPFYSIRDVLRAHINGVPWKQLATHYKNALISLRYTAHLINADFIKSVVVLSRRNHDILGEMILERQKIKVIPPGFIFKSTENMQISRETQRGSLSLPPRDKIIIYLGSLYEIRGINILLKAFSRIRNMHENVSLLILARSESEHEVETLAKQVEQLGIAQKTVIKSGYLDNDTVQRYLSASDIAVLPFVLVPSDMPVAALEAMALGKPVITTDIDGMKEMVQDRGILVKPGSVAELSQAIQRLIQDDHLYSTASSNCLEYMARYPSRDEVSKQFIALFEDQRIG
jgi:phosphatidyl-myo-inositol dimannoside synthase